MPKLNKLMTKAPQGFTLVELSIVIIIIGFLIAGIAAGTSLVQQAALNSVIVEAQTYLAAFNTFKSRYSYYPGDFPYASSYWPNTVNGNGDGLIQYPDENQGVWEQLNADKIISLT